MAPPRPRPPSSGLAPGRAREAAAFIRANLPLTEVPGTGIRLHLAGPRSGLSRLVPPGGTPYWAHAWPGGVALAMHLAARPGDFGDLGAGGPPPHAWELGAGSGLVSIALRRAGGRATATDPDPLALVAMRLNARANGVALDARPGGFAATAGALDGLARRPTLLLAGDVFYDQGLAAEAAACFDRQPPHVTILVGDIGRRFLPRDRLEPLASYPVRDPGDPPSAPARDGWVYRWKP